MKKSVLLILICLVTILTVHANARWYVVSQNVNVREGAGTNFKIIGTVTQGTKFYLLSDSGAWVKVNHNNRVGFISTKFLQETTPPVSDGDRPFGYKGLIGGTFGLIVIVCIIGTILRGIWRRITGNDGYSSGSNSDSDLDASIRRMKNQDDAAKRDKEYWRKYNERNEYEKEQKRIYGPHD